MTLHATLIRLLTIVLVLAAQPAAAQSVLPDDEPDVRDEDEDENEDDEPPDEPVRAKKRAKTKAVPKTKDRRLTSGLGFTLGLGGLATLRRMNFSGTDHRITHQPGAYLGGAIQATQLVLTAPKTKSHVLAEIEGGFGSAKNAEIEPAIGRKLTTEHAYLLILGMFEKPIHPVVDLRLGLGISALSYTVEKNPEYTGHRYISLAASFGGAYWVAERTKIGANFVFLPGLDTNQSSRDYGSASSFGGRGEAYVSWRFLQPEPPDVFGSGEVGFRYTYSRFQTTMPETQVLGDRAATADAAHALTVSVSYNL